MDTARITQAKKTRNFCRRLVRRQGIEIIYVDEYLSSVEAKERLRMAGKDVLSKTSRAVIDAASAAVILQLYLDLNNNKKIIKKIKELNT